ncbi:MAG: aminotransferase class IV [Proteobacteria bacterium]|nr:aminotransferase class IV [Pseudomonadota bacterium]
MTSPNTVWLSGRFLTEDEARVPVSSRTLTLGLGLYESFRVAGGKAPLLDLHLARLERSAREAGLQLDAFDWEEALEGLARRNRRADGRGRLTLGDGFVLLTLGPLPADLELEQREGIELRTREASRTAEHKSTARFDLELLERQERGETLRVDPDGEALETTRANFFALRNGALETASPPAVLPGIARALVCELAALRGLPVSPRPPRLSERGAWQEAFVSNAVRGIRPVARLDGAPLPLGGPGSVTRSLQTALNERLAGC